MSRLFSLLFAALFAMAAAPAGAQDFGEYLQASKTLMAMRDLPRLKDPVGPALLDVLGDNRTFLDKRPFTADDMSPLMEVCGIANKISVSYMLHGLDKGLAGVDKNDLQAAARAMQAVAMRNVFEYQDELAILMPFTLRCQARMAPLMEDFLRKLPPEELTDVRKGGVRQIQNGAFGSYSGYLTMITGSGIKDANLRRMSGTMAEVAPSYASIMQLAQRRQLRELATATKAKVPAALASDLEKVIEAMASDSCNALCSVQ